MTYHPVGSESESSCSQKPCSFAAVSASCQEDRRALLPEAKGLIQAMTQQNFISIKEGLFGQLHLLAECEKGHGKLQHENLFSKNSVMKRRESKFGTIRNPERTEELSS